MHAAARKNLARNQQTRVTIRARENVNLPIKNMKIT